MSDDARHGRTKLRWVTHGIFYSFVLALLLAPGVFLVNLVSYLIRNSEEQNWEREFEPEQVYRLRATYLLVLLVGLIILWFVCYRRRHNDD